MPVEKQTIERIVREVLKHMDSNIPGAPCASSGSVSAEGESGIFETLDDAIAAAFAAQARLDTVATRNTAVAAMRRTALKNSEILARMAHEETGMGRVEDKITKICLQARRTPGTEVLRPLTMTGDSGLTIIENAPWGVVASVTPSTNPVATVINNGISMIAAGNAVVFAPHPSAKRCTQKAIQLLNDAVCKETGIANLLVSVREPSLESATRLFSWKGIHLLVVTGGEAVVEAARKHATMRLIAAGAGNPPVVVDETAHIARAARSIYDGASFDNNIICADEKEIIAVESIADELKGQLRALGAHELSLEAADKVARKVLRNYPDGNASADPKWVGRDAAVIAEACGISVPKSCRLLLVDVGRDVKHVFARVEQMMPVIPLLRAKNVDEAIEWACILERGLHHTAGMHSTNIDNLNTMAKKINTSLFVKNGPHIAGLGAGGEGWSSMTISTPTGEGVTNAASFVRLRRCVLVDNFRIV